MQCFSCGKEGKSMYLHSITPYSENRFLLCAHCLYYATSENAYLCENERQRKKVEEVDDGRRRDH